MLTALPLQPALVFASALSVAIAGGTRCPTSAEISGALEQLSARGGAARGERVEVTPSGEGLRLELLDAGGGLLSARELPAQATCELTATAAAVVIAAWELKIDGGVSLLLPAAAPPSLLPTAPPPTPHRPAAARLAVDGSVGFLFSIASLEPGVVADLAAGPDDSRFSLRASLFGFAPARLPLGPGSAEWSRVGLTLGPRLRLSLGRALVYLHLSLVAAALLSGGEGVVLGSGAVELDPGSALGARVLLHHRSVGFFLGVDGVAWFLRQPFFADGIADHPEAPRLDLYLSTGISLGRF